MTDSLDDALAVIRAAVSCDLKKATSWYFADPIDAFDGLTAAALVLQGRARDILLQFTLNDGRSVELKRRLYMAIADGLHERLKLRKEDVFISLVEVRKEKCSFGNGEAVRTLDHRPPTSLVEIKLNSSIPSTGLWRTGGPDVGLLRRFPDQCGFQKPLQRCATNSGVGARDFSLSTIRDCKPQAVSNSTTEGDRSIQFEPTDQSRFYATRLSAASDRQGC